MFHQSRKVYLINQARGLSWIYQRRNETRYILQDIFFKNTAQEPHFYKNIQQSHHKKKNFQL